MDKILSTTKKAMGIPEVETGFDQDLIMHINGVFMILNQMGVGPDTPYMLTTGDETWSEFSTNVNKINLIKTYMYMKVRLMFDPPTSGTLLESMNRMIGECEFRLNFARELEVAAATTTTTTDEDDDDE